MTFIKELDEKLSIKSLILSVVIYVSVTKVWKSIPNSVAIVFSNEFTFRILDS